MSQQRRRLTLTEALQKQQKDINNPLQCHGFFGWLKLGVQDGPPFPVSFPME
jgi:hypothetical protein